MNCYEFDTIVIGSGCAGLNAADCLKKEGCKRFALVTEGMNMGTSRNAGSDKQTYYKLGLSSDCTDGVLDMAQTYFDGRCTHGDLAMVEAANSPAAFFKLVNLGVPFPKNDYGEFVGYRTDHSVQKRATSAGPLTSRYMTEALEKEVVQSGIPIFDHMQIVKLVVADGSIAGAIGLDTNTHEFHAFCASSIILATGGPAAVYADRVYPGSQTGMSGMAILAGAKTENLTEWQYGLASIKFRWNVSGTYQQALPRYISVDPDGTEHALLTGPDDLGREFQKGYEWPFDSAKATGSSAIDLLVHQERAKGRRVFLDYTRDPAGLDFATLPKEAYDYLLASDALLKTPIARLERMNPQAIALYRSHGINLFLEPLEIAVCAQHLNGGLAVDIHYETSIRGLYAVGEAAGVFGVARPGGSALNSTQVGAMRAAQHIAKKAGNRGTNLKFVTQEAERFYKKIAYAPVSNLKKYTSVFPRKMSDFAGFLRDSDEIKQIYTQVTALLKDFPSTVQIAKPYELSQYLKLYDTLITTREVLSAMQLWCEHIGVRGGAVLANQFGAPQNHGFDQQVICTRCGEAYFEPVRPIPQTDTWFESIWNKQEKGE